MKNNYHLMLLAGSRINGAKLYGSEAERRHADKDLETLILELGDSLISIHDNLGFLTVSLTEEEADKYSKDIRVYSIELQQPKTVCSYTDRDISYEKNWALRVLSHNKFEQNKLLCGFELDYSEQIYSYNSENFIAQHGLKLVSTTNKLVYKLELFNYELTSEEQILNINWSHEFPLNTDLYVCFNPYLESFSLKEPSNDLTDQYILYTVKIEQYNSTVLDYFFGSSARVYGFYDIKLLPKNAYTYTATAQGEGVTAIIGDTQLNPTVYAEFGDRAKIVYNPYASDYITRYGKWDSNSDDISTHGTCVASILGGSTCGIAPLVQIHGITCLDETTSYGNNSTKVLDCLNYILGYAQVLRNANAPNPVPIVCNFSFGSVNNNGHDSAEDAAIEALTTDGIIVVIAAGNDNGRRNRSPWGSKAIIVGATDEELKPADFSDYGPEVNIWAPGKDIYVANNTYAYERGQGTSYAAPFVAGLCALYLSLHPNATVEDVRLNILNTARAYITYNKADSTYLFAQHSVYYEIIADSILTAPSRPRLIHTVIPKVINLDGSVYYGEWHTLTSNPIADAIISAGQLETTELATAFRLDP